MPRKPQVSFGPDDHSDPIGVSSDRAGAQTCHHCLIWLLSSNQAIVIVYIRFDFETHPKSKKPRREPNHKYSHNDKYLGAACTADLVASPRKL